MSEQVQPLTAGVTQDDLIRAANDNGHAMLMIARLRAKLAEAERRLSKYTEASSSKTDWCPVCKQGWDCARQDKMHRDLLHLIVAAALGEGDGPSDTIARMDYPAAVKKAVEAIKRLAEAERKVVSLRLRLKESHHVPEGYERIEAWTNGREVVVLGTPSEEDELAESSHDCDQMGCGGVCSPHVLLRVPLASAPPQTAAAEGGDGVEPCGRCGESVDTNQRGVVVLLCPDCQPEVIGSAHPPAPDAATGEREVR